MYLQSNDGPLYIPSQTILMRETIDREILQSLLSREEEEESSWKRCGSCVGLFLRFFIRVVSVPELHMDAFRFASLLDFSLAFQLVFYVRVFEVCIRMWGG